MNVIMDMPYSVAWADSGDTTASINKLKKALTCTIRKFSPTGHQSSTKLCLLEEADVVVEDGSVEGVMNKGWRIRTGLLYRVQNVAPAFGLEIKIVRDLRLPADQWPKQPLVGGTLEVSLRPYQEDLVTRILQQDMGVMEAATGAGKTRMAAAMISRTHASTLFLVHTKDLLEQARAALSGLLGIEVGVVGDGVKDIKPVTVGMVQTMINMGEEMYWDMVIVDETHHLPADTLYSVTSHFKSRRVYGLSATSYRQDGGDLLIEAGAGPISAKIGASELIRDGVLVRPVIRFLPVPDKTSYSPAPAWAAYSKYVVKNVGRNKMVAKWAKEFVDKGMSVVVAVRHLKHAALIGELLQAQGTEFVVLDGKDKSETRQRVLQELRDKKTRLVLSTLLSEGVDVPSLDCLINASGGRDTMQLVGRVLRASPGKKVATIMDFVDNGHVTLQRTSWARIKRLKEESEFFVMVG
jgi:superfamily II DNA or RNA helicase